MSVNPTMIWRVRPSGNNSNGGGFDPSVASPGTDYSKQNSAQVTFNGSSITATTSGASATITVSGYTVAATDPGNVLHITGGTNFTAGWYEIMSRTGSTWTLDRVCSTGSGSGMTGSMGGGWADFWTNTTSSGPLQPGNQVLVLGSGTPNPSSYTYDYTCVTGGFVPVSGDTTNGFITYANDPDTLGYKAAPDTTGGMPCIQGGTIFAATPTMIKVLGLWFVNSGVNGVNANVYNFVSTGTPCFIMGCVHDQFGNGGAMAGSAIDANVIGCEDFNSAGGGASGSSTTSAMLSIQSGCSAVGCNIHDTRGVYGLLLNNAGTARSCICAKNSGIGIYATASGGQFNGNVSNCTIDGNAGDGLAVRDSFVLNGTVIFNNIITNHTVGGKYGINVLVTGGAGQDDRCKALVDYNSFYNNTANFNDITTSSHDTALGVTPYVNSSTQDYTLA